MKTPSCATPEQYKKWVAASAKQYTPDSGIKNYGFCADCTHNYQRKMIAQNRCDNPHLDIQHIEKLAL